MHSMGNLSRTPGLLKVPCEPVLTYLCPLLGRVVSLGSLSTGTVTWTFQHQSATPNTPSGGWTPSTSQPHPATTSGILAFGCWLLVCTGYGGPRTNRAGAPRPRDTSSWWSWSHPIGQWAHPAVMLPSALAPGSSHPRYWRASGSFCPRFAKYYKINGSITRTLIKAYGIRIDVIVHGQVGQRTLFTWDPADPVLVSPTTPHASLGPHSWLSKVVPLPPGGEVQPDSHHH